MSVLGYVTNGPKTAARGRDLIIGAIFALVSYAVFMNGFNPSVQVWGEFHWLINYEHGFIRRGLVGSLFQRLYGGAPIDLQRSYIVLINISLSFLIIALLSFWLTWILAMSRSIHQKIALTAIAGLFATSQFLPTAAYNTGYLDIVLHVLVVLATISAAFNAPGIAAILGGTAPFVHESFIFLWPPIGLIVLSSHYSSPYGLARRLLYAAAPIIGTVAVILAHNHHAAAAEVMDLPLPADIKDGVLRWQLGQTASQALVTMVSMHIKYWPKQVWAALFFCGPAILMILIHVSLRADQLGWRSWLALAASLLSPLAALAFAWDLSRFLVPANLTVFTTILALEMGLRQHPGLRPWPAAIAFPIVAGAIFAPFVYAYFESSIVEHRGFLQARGSLPARLVTTFSRDILNFPRGSYEQTCTNVSFRNGILTATCMPSSGPSVQSELHVSECRGDIGTVNGHLACSRNQ